MVLYVGLDASAGNMQDYNGIRGKQGWLIANAYQIILLVTYERVLGSIMYIIISITTAIGPMPGGSVT
jgi:hypothetical protein